MLKPISPLANKPRDWISVTENYAEKNAMEKNSRKKNQWKKLHTKKILEKIEAGKLGANIESQAKNDSLKKVIIFPTSRF